LAIIPKIQGSRFKVKKAAPLALAPCTLHLNKGFTLLELIVVLFIVVLGFSVVGINLSSGNDSTQLKVAARDIVSALRYARGQALLSHHQTTVTLDLNENSYTVSGRDKVYVIPKTINVTVVTAQSELTGEGLGNIRFFADGSSTGGRITLERGKAAWQIDINWLTGQIELDDTGASE
jgi:general secretion pathway protein H